MGSDDVLKNALFESVLKYPISDILSLRQHGINAGYPIALSVMVMVETVSSIRYQNGSDAGGADVAKYFGEYFSRVSPLYSPSLGGTDKDNAEKFGGLLYKYLRCKLGHDANAIRGFPVDAQSQLYHRHLKPAGRSAMLVHAYRLFDDFLATLDLMADDAEADPDVFRIVMGGISGYLSRIEQDSEKLAMELFRLAT